MRTSKFDVRVRCESCLNVEQLAWSRVCVLILRTLAAGATFVRKSCLSYELSYSFVHCGGSRLEVACA